MFEQNEAPLMSPFEALFIRQLDLETELDSKRDKLDQVDGNILPYTNDDPACAVFKYLDEIFNNVETKVEDHFKGLPTDFMIV